MLTEDALTARADLLLERHDPVPLVSDFARTEFASAIAIGLRDRRFTEPAARAAFQRLDAWTGMAARPVGTEPADIALAERFIRRLDLTLRTQDAIHIAMARRLDAALVTFDRRMAEAARRLGLAVLDA